VINLALVSVAFRDRVRLVAKPSPTDAAGMSRNQGAWDLVAQTLGARSVWLLSLFYFFYLGASITAGGWVVEYLVVVRNGDLARMGYVAVGFSGGGLLGRLLLAEPTHRWGERRMVFLYSVLCVGLQVLFWL
jgi:fucose permease